jgi:hypothetical protein
MLEKRDLHDREERGVVVRIDLTCRIGWKMRPKRPKRAIGWFR